MDQESGGCEHALQFLERRKFLRRGFIFRSIPDKFVRTVLKMGHDDKAHLGANRTRDYLRESVSTPPKGLLKLIPPPTEQLSTSVLI